MRRAAAIAAAAVLALAGCGERQGRRFCIGVDSAYAPWCYVDAVTGQYTGFDVEMARAVCARLGWHPVFRSVDTAHLVRLIDSGEIDCIWCCFTIDGREDRLCFAGPYARNSLVVVARREAGIRRNSDLADKVVAVQDSTTSELIFRPGGRQERLGKTFRCLIKGANSDICLRRLTDGVADALVVDVDLARSHVRRFPDLLEIVDDAPLQRKSIGVAFRKDDFATRNAVAREMRALEAEGFCASLAKKFLGSAERYHWESK